MFGQLCGGKMEAGSAFRGLNLSKVINTLLFLNRSNQTYVVMAVIRSAWVYFSYHQCMYMFGKGTG